MKEKPLKNNVKHKNELGQIKALPMNHLIVCPQKKK
jgi:hypothetical protein